MTVAAGFDGIIVRFRAHGRCPAMLVASLLCDLEELRPDATVSHVETTKAGASTAYEWTEVCLAAEYPRYGLADPAKAADVKSYLEWAGTRNMVRNELIELVAAAEKRAAEAEAALAYVEAQPSEDAAKLEAAERRAERLTRDIDAVIERKDKAQREAERLDRELFAANARATAAEEREEQAQRRFLRAARERDTAQLATKSIPGDAPRRPGKATNIRRVRRRHRTDVLVKPAVPEPDRSGIATSDPESLPPILQWPEPELTAAGRRRFTDEHRAIAVAMAADVGPGETARRLGLAEGMLYRWRRDAEWESRPDATTAGKPRDPTPLGDLAETYFSDTSRATPTSTDTGSGPSDEEAKPEQTPAETAVKPREESRPVASWDHDTTVTPVPPGAVEAWLLDYPDQIAGLVQDKGGTWARADGKPLECTCGKTYKSLGGLRAHRSFQDDAAQHLLMGGLETVDTVQLVHPLYRPGAYVAKEGNHYECACGTKVRTVTKMRAHVDGAYATRDGRDHFITREPAPAAAPTAEPDELWCEQCNPRQQFRTPEAFAGHTDRVHPPAKRPSQLVDAGIKAPTPGWVTARSR